MFIACLFLGCQGTASVDEAEPRREGGLAERGQATADPENRGVFSERRNLGEHDLEESLSERPELVETEPGKAGAVPAGTMPAAGTSGDKQGAARAEPAGTMPAAGTPGSKQGAAGAEPAGTMPAAGTPGSEQGAAGAEASKQPGSEQGAAEAGSKQPGSEQGAAEAGSKQGAVAEPASKQGGV